ncbi:MAG: BTAD domain-containing putative transcriptional regulator [Chloroflexota bacterium]
MLSLHLLGAVQVYDGDRLLPPFPTQRSRELFAHLAVKPNHPHARASLAGNLWPEKTEEKARASLNTELWRVRQTLGAEAETCLELTRETVALNLPPEQVDIHKFRALVKQGEVAALKEAVALYRGEFLEGCYADWCLLEREQLSDLFRVALEGLLRYHESRGELTEAIAFVKRVHSFDPLREDMHRALMRLYAALGDRPAALAQYQLCKSVLKRELGVAPMPETEALYLKIRKTAPLEDYWSVRREAARRAAEGRLAEMRRAKQYLPDLYAPRLALDAQVESFIASDATGLVLVGHSGCGMTNYLARLAETRLAQGDLVLLLDAGSLTLNIQSELTRLAWGSETVSAVEALAALGREAAGRGRVVWVLMDELNAFRDLGAGPADLFRRLDSLIASLHLQSDAHAVKMVLACRDHPWRLLTLGGAADLNREYYYNREPVLIERYDAQETKTAFEQYRRFYRLQTPFDELTDEFKERCRTPFFLHLIAETWQGGAIPSSASSGQLFRAYFERVVENPVLRRFVADLVVQIARHRRSDLLLSDLRADPTMQSALADDLSSPLHQLIEAGVLSTGGSDFAPRLRFTHERLLEYLLAQYYDTQCAEGVLAEDCLIDLARDSWTFPALWGAALTLLLLGKSATQFLLLAESDATEARQLATEGLAALHEEDASLARSLAKRLLERPSLEAKRVALFAASRMGAEGFDLFRAASESRDAATRQTAIVVINAIYQRDPQTVLAILHRLLDDIRLQTFITAAARLQVGIRSLGLFTRYGIEKKLMDEAEELIHTLTVKRLHLPTESNRVGRTLIQRLLSITTTSWPADRNAVAEVARPGSMTDAERAAFRRVLDCLKQREAGLDSVSPEDLQTLLASPLDAVRYLAHHQLCLWLNLRQEEAVQVVQSLFDSLDDSEIRLWLLMTFQPLNAPGVRKFTAESLHALENLTARFAEENREIFLRGASRGTLGLIGPIGFFPLGMRYARARKFDFPLLAAYLAKEPQATPDYLRALAPVGWFHLQEALARFELHVDFRKPLHPQAVESLGLLWVSHPDEVDLFLRGAGVTDAVQRQIHAAVDIEKTLRAINMIHTTDLRVSSVLLGAPYGRWVTDSVFAGYVESGSFEEAASRFGRGLVDVYVESGWKLKRILGLT